MLVLLGVCLTPAVGRAATVVCCVVVRAPHLHVLCDVVCIWDVHSSISGIPKLRPLAQRHFGSFGSQAWGWELLAGLEVALANLEAQNNVCKGVGAERCAWHTRPKNLVRSVQLTPELGLF